MVRPSDPEPNADPTRSSSGWAPVSVADTGVDQPAAQGDHPVVEGYQILSLLGQGGMGTVWRAVQLSTSRTVAIKFLSGAITTPRARTRFEREVEMLARVEHPNIARLYHSGVHQGVCYYTMELVEGDHLDTYVAQRRLDTPAILRLMAVICRAINHAHQQGVIHRDLKPTNMRVSADGQPHVLDFGLAKAAFENGPTGDRTVPHTITVEGTVAGTLAYMSPEQAAGKLARVDLRTDVYSLGVILYKLLTGHFPHDMEGSSFDVQKRIVDQEPIRPRAASKLIDAELESLLLKALARDPAQRYATAGELADDIDRYLNREPLHARPATTVYFARKWLQRHKAAVTIVAAVLLLINTIVAIAFWQVTRERDLARAAEQSALRALYVNQITRANDALDRDDVAEAMQALDEAPESLRHWEWHWLRAQADQSVASFELKQDGVRGAAMTPDGRLVTVGDSSRAVWGLSGHLLSRSELPPAASDWGASLSKDGRYVAMADDESLTVEDMQLGRRTLVAHGYSERISHPVFSHDGRWLATIDARGAGVVKVWDVATLSQVHGYQLPRRSRLAALQGRDLIALMTDAGFELVELGDSVKVSQIECPSLRDLAFTADGERIVTVSNDLRVRVWSVATGQLKTTLEGLKTEPASLAVGDSGHWIAAGERSGSIVWWDMADNSRLERCHGHSLRPVRLIIDERRHQLISFDFNQTVKVWNLSLPPRGVRNLRLMDRGPAMTNDFSGDGKQLLALTVGSSVATLIDVASGQTHALSAPESLVRGALSADGRWAAAISTPISGVIYVWDLLADDGPRELARSVGVVDLALNVDGSRIVAIGGPDAASATVYSVATGDVIASFAGTSAGAFTADARHFLTVLPDGMTLGLYNTNDWRETARLAGHSGQVLDIALSTDGSTAASTDRSGRVVVWGLFDRAMRALVNPYAGRQLSGIALSPDGRRLLTAGPTVKLFVANTGRELIEIRPPSDGNHSSFSVAFCPDGKTLAVGGSGGVVLYSGR